MTENIYIPLNRSLVKISGADSKKFLQGLITNDVEQASDKKAIYAYILTPQGKYLFDLFLFMKDGSYIVDISTGYIEDFLKKIKMYKLRSEVEIEDISSDYEVACLIGSKVAEKYSDEFKEGNIMEFCKGIAYIDPRSKNLYARSVIERDNKYQAFHAQQFTLSNIEQYHRIRIANNIPEGEYDLSQEGSFPLQFRMLKLNGVDFNKGCYVGQEVTARTHHRGKLRKTVFVLEAAQKILAAKNDEIRVSDSKIGEFLSSCGNTALSLLDVEFANSNKSFEFEGVEYKILS